MEQTQTNSTHNESSSLPQSEYPPPPDVAYPEKAGTPPPSYEAHGQNNQGQNNQGQNNQGQTNQGYNNLGQNSQGYSNQGQNNQGQNNPGQNNQGQNNQGYNNQGFNTQTYNNQGYNGNYPPPTGSYSGYPTQPYLHANSHVSHQASNRSTVVIAQGTPIARGSDYMTCSILSCIFCNCILGIIAIVYSSKARDNYDQGRTAEGRRYATTARTINIVSLILGLVGLVGIIVAMVIAFGTVSFRATSGWDTCSSIDSDYSYYSYSYYTYYYRYYYYC